MDALCFFLHLVMIAGVFISYTYVEEITDDAWDIYSELMESNHLEEKQDDENTLS